MSGQVRLADGVSVDVVAGLGVFVLSERAQWMSGSPVLWTLCAALGRGGTVPEILARAAPALPEAEARYGLARLQAAGVIVDGAPTAAPTAAAPAWCRAGEAAVIVALSGTGPDGGATALQAALAAGGVEPGRWHPGLPPAQAAAQRIVVADDPLAIDGPALRHLAAPGAVVAKLVGARVWVGPQLGPGALCPGCLLARLAAARPVEAFLAARTGRPFGLAPADPSVGAAGQAAAARLAEAVAANAPPGETGVILETLADGSLRRHRVAVPAPDCARCAGDAPAAAPPALRPGKPIAPAAGGYRCATPERTLARLAPLIGDLAGVVAAEWPVPAGPGRHVHAAAVPRRPADAQPGPDAFRLVALGKGRSAAQARVSALAEAVERVAPVWRPGIACRWASLQALGADARGPEALWQFSAAQTAARAELNAATPDPRRHVPPPLAPDDVIAWTRTWSLTAACWRWVPREHDRADAPAPRHGRYNPNGAAAGTTLAEAAIQGLLELVERDAVAIWWYNRLRQPEVPLEEAPDLAPLTDGLRAAGWAVWALDLTTDLGVPVVAALARAETGGRWCVGFGAHLTRPLALERALSELAQLFRRDGRDGPPPWADDPCMGEAHLHPDPGAPPPPPPAITDEGAATCADLLDRMVGLLAGRGFEVLLTDLSRPDLPLRVAKMTVPGLRHFWPRFGPGRLYDVPVATGRRASALPEAALNPVALFV